MTRVFLGAIGFGILLLAMACGGGTANEDYVSEMNALMSQHVDTYTMISDELDRNESQLRRSRTPETAIALMRNIQTVMTQAEEKFEDVFNQWADLEPPKVARSFHARASEMMQLRLSGARYNRAVIETFITTYEFDLDTAEQATDAWLESDRLYLDVVAEGRTVGEIDFK